MPLFLTGAKEGRSLAWLTLAFVLHWSWQTCVLYLAPEPLALGGPPWYLQNLLGVLAYGAVCAFAPKLQPLVQAVYLRWTAVGLLTASYALRVAASWSVEAHPAAAISAGGLAAVGGALITICRFDLLCRIRQARKRTAVVFLATMGQLLVYLLFRSLPHSVGIVIMFIAPAALAFSLGKTKRGLDIERAGRSAEVPPTLPSIQLLAFFLLALSLNFMRALIEAAGDIPSKDGHVIGLTVFITIIFVVMELVLGDRNAKRLAPFSIVLLMSAAAVIPFIEHADIALAGAFSSAGFYVFVALFWQATSGYPCGRIDCTVYISSITHVIYTAGLFAGQLVFKALGNPEGARLFGPLLLIANIALAGAFILYIRDLEKREPDHRIYLAPGLMGTLEADGEILAREAHLTNKERQAIVALATGKSIATIARAQCVSENTVKTHVAHAYRKLDIHSREELMELICATDGERLNRARELQDD